ncbi:regulatory iron-sulfur-containing complex subunit RicT [Segetibacter koreensis]|uniref:regulatory iron-sulfur-containing complex subunit RicT n=1 Tax=Segetibacter koreensis TaxID=398037 RepID=UPI000382E1ED|nr:regulatory iron-sulfur-containing complex subunit RicT [Segetibacter koreensis]
MGCGSCGTGKPNGCKSNGGCSTGGCNRMNVHDWLMNLPFSDPESTCKIVEVSFNNGSRKEFYRNATLQYFEKGEYVSVEGVSGFDVGEVSLSGELVRLQMKKKGVEEFSPEIKKILRKSTETDIAKWEENKAREKEALVRSRAMARKMNLEMKLAEVEIQADGKKATFYYTADDRVDFRELIRMYASEFKVKVEMRQIGARQEAGKVGGIGSCGRELCCATWLTDFKSVNTTAARYQNLSINQTKLSGQCGRLKCCLNYELDTYLDALQQFPDNADVIQITRSSAFLVKKDIFKNLMWYTMPDSTKHYPLTIARVKEIQKMNAQGLKPDELEPVEIVSSKPKEVEPEFVDVVGQISLRSLEKNSRRRKDREQGNDGRGSDRRPQESKVNQSGASRPNRQQQQSQQKNLQQGTQQRPGINPNQQRPVAKPANVAQQAKQQNTPRGVNQQSGVQQSRPAQQRPAQQKPGERPKPQPRPTQQKPPQKENETPPEVK